MKLIHLVKLDPSKLFAGVMIGGFATIPFTTVAVFINSVLMTEGFLNKFEFMLVQTILTLSAIFSLIVFGKLADRFKFYKIMGIASILLTVLSYPLLKLIDSNYMAIIILSEICFIAINEMLLAPAHSYFKHLFPAEYRYRASSISFCIGISALGGITPLVEHCLYQIHHRFFDIALWPTIIGLITYYSFYLANRRLIDAKIS